MNINKDVDLGQSFERLKDALNRAEQYKNREIASNLKYAGAYGILCASVQAFLFINTDIKCFDDLIDTPVFNSLPDIDKDIENELID